MLLQLSLFPILFRSRNLFPVLFRVKLKTLQSSLRSTSSPLTYSHFQGGKIHHHHMNDDAAANQTQWTLGAKDQFSSRRNCSDYRWFFETKINHQLKNRDIDHPACATRRVQLSDRLQIPDHRAIITISTEDQDLFQILWTIRHPNLHLRHQRGMYSIVRTFYTAGTIYQKHRQYSAVGTLHSQILRVRFAK